MLSQSPQGVEDNRDVDRFLQKSVLNRGKYPKAAATMAAIDSLGPMTTL